MRRIRKALSAVLALVMLLSLVVPVSAEGEAATIPGAGSLESQTATFTVTADPATPQQDTSGGRLVKFHIYVSGTVPIQAFSFNLAPSAGLELAATLKVNADDQGFYYDYPRSALAWAEGEGKYNTFGYSNDAANPMYFAAAGMDAGHGISAQTEVLTIVGRVAANTAYSLGLINVIAGDGDTVDSEANQFTRVVTPASGTTGLWEPNVSASTDAAEPVDTFTVKLSHGDMTVGSFTGGLRFDTSRLAVTKIETLGGYSSLASGVVSELSTVAEANQTGQIGAAFVRTEEQTFAAGDILAVTFRSREEGTATVTPYEDSDGADGYIGDGASVTVSTKTPLGVTVSGTALSWNSTDDATYVLYPASMSDAAIKAEWKARDSFSGTVCGSKSAPTASGKQYAQTFSFDLVTADEYKLAIFKPGKYVPKIVSITVEDSAHDCGQLKLWLYGDVNYDGVINTADGMAIYRKAAGKPSVFDLSADSDILLSADINFDGVINTADGMAIYRKAAGKASALDLIK